MSQSIVQSLVTVRGMPLHWVEHGKGRPLILLHGLADSHRTWRSVLAPLRGSRRILMPDLPGHGLSGRPDASYSLAWHAEMLSAWVDLLGLDEFDLVGHSYGGGVAQFMLLTHAARVRRLGLVAPGGLGREVAAGVRLLTLPGAEHVVSPFLGIGTGIGLAVAAPSVWEASEARWAAWSNSMPGTARAITRTARGIADLGGQSKQFLDRAHEVDALPPIAMFWGDRDRVIPFRHGIDAQSRVLNARLTMFRRCGHFPHLERPDAFAHALGAFLDDDGVRRARIVVALRPRRRAGWMMRMVRFLRRFVSPWGSRRAAQAQCLPAVAPPPSLPARPHRPVPIGR